jgi:hypothetical protein
VTTHVRQSLKGQSFAGQDLRGWSFESCDLTGCDFRGAITDETTVLFDCNIAGIHIDFGAQTFDALLVKCYGKSTEFKAWEKQTPDERRARERKYKREWRKENLHRARQIASKARDRWIANNPERNRAIVRHRQRAFRKKNPELVRERDRARKQLWRAANQEKNREIQRRANRRYMEKKRTTNELAEVGTSPSQSVGK